MRTSSLTCLVAVVGLGASFSCSTGGDGGFISGASTGGTSSIFAAGGSGSGPSIVTQKPDNFVDLSGEPATPGCGDGVLAEDEACDDNNTDSGDGCLANCRQVEWGYSCVPAGEPCHQIARCGDGVMAFPELCDDGNTKAGDGCSPSCKYEIGYKCDGTPSSCTPTTCGDGKMEGAESCEDGNTMPFDGCSSDCQNEPKCGEGPCTSACGDGIVLNEECDDGNQISGDGCSSDCTEEPGFTCKTPPLGDSMTVPMVVRDFDSGGDFEKAAEFATGLNYANQGLLKDRLEGAARKPVLAATTGTYDGSPGKNSGIASAQSFAQWYDDAASGPNKHNATLATKLNLFLNEDQSAYVNRYGKDGDGLTSTQYMRTKRISCGQVGKEDHDADGKAIPCTVCYYDPDPSTPECDQHQATECETNPNFMECVKSQSGDQWEGVVLDVAFDGNPIFFPADSLKPYSPSTTSQISGNYDPSWPATPGNHNFSFTTEVRYWFQYDSTTKYQLRFVGDDDVWVFINGKLAVDLGGIHTAVQGDLTIENGKTTVVVTSTVVASANNTTGTNNGSGKPITSHPDLGMTSGQVYEIVVLQAERQTKASSYQLTLSGFSAAASDCSPFCGDGIVGIGEECDDGKNDGGYGECGPDCKLGEYCGDGIMQEGEDCDDGVNIGSPCQSGCRDILLL